jgi:hypothetical protein
MPPRIPIEAVALIEYAERHGMLIYPGSEFGDGDGGNFNPDFLYTSQQAREELDAAHPNAFIRPDRYDRWQLVDPADVLRQLEQNYKIAMSDCETAKAYLESFRETVAVLKDRPGQRT